MTRAVPQSFEEETALREAVVESSMVSSKTMLRLEASALMQKISHANEELRTLGEAFQRQLNSVNADSARLIEVRQRLEEIGG
jgi:hypothetical protein